MEKYVCNLTRTMFSCADNGECIHLQVMAPYQASPPEERPLPRKLLLSPQLRPNEDKTGDHEDDEEEA
ncbi:unnamed protein product [Euphydryas editha]|uniref:Uncharacterized protein n=1 Tax=Euphydryas editha TaxID=104508 RepID=A0AAU9U3Q3_EUPED|nr:unnamed protein product [Euphydryas editha]